MTRFEEMNAAHENILAFGDPVGREFLIHGFKVVAAKNDRGAPGTHWCKVVAPGCSIKITDSDGDYHALCAAIKDDCYRVTLFCGGRATHEALAGNTPESALRVALALLLRRMVGTAGTPRTLADLLNQAQAAIFGDSCTYTHAHKARRAYAWDGIGDFSSPF